MLGKTANGLYWMYRYLERAECTARLIDTGQRIALTRSNDTDDEWMSVLKAASVYQAFQANYETLTKDAAIDWMLRSSDNPSSVLSLVKSARHNARMVRTALTHEVWEAMNGTYMAVKDALARKVNERDLPAVLGLIRQRAALVRGTTDGTMLRNDIYNFARVGTFIERADNTARILSVKYYVLLPSAGAVGSRLDNVQWDTILQSVSAKGGYRLVHGNVVRPRDIADFLIFDRRMPRSLNFCASKLQGNLSYLANDYGSTMASHDKVSGLTARFATQDIDVIFEQGLHQYIQHFLGSLADLGAQIEIDYRFAE